MIVTLPVLYPGSSPAIRQRWICPDRKLPETIHVAGFTLEPANNIVVHEVSYQSCRLSREQPWTIVWVKLEVPDDMQLPFDFEFVNPKSIPDLIRSEPMGERARRVAAKMKGVHTVSVQEIIEEHKRRTANAVPDIDVPGI